MYDPLWTTKDGRTLKVGQMETRHIENAIAMILRSPRAWRVHMLPRLRLELYMRSIGLRGPTS